MTHTTSRRAWLALALAASCGTAAAQGFPARPITLVVPNPPGGLVGTA